MRSIFPRLSLALLLACTVPALPAQTLSPHPAARVAIQGNAYQGSWTDFSGTIASTGVDQALFPSDRNRTGCFIQNQGTHTMTVNVPGINAVTHLQLVASAYYECPWIFIPTVAITITGTTGDAYAAAEW